MAQPDREMRAGELRWPAFVLGRLHRHARAVTEEQLAGVGLSLRDYATLVHVDELEQASQQQVADRAQMDRSDLVKLLDSLEARELITRRRDPDDRRRHVLALTAGGRVALRRGTVASRRATDAAFAALSSTELRTLHRLALKALGEPVAFADIDAAGPASH